MSYLYVADDGTVTAYAVCRLANHAHEREIEVEKFPDLEVQALLRDYEYVDGAARKKAVLPERPRSRIEKLEARIAELEKRVVV